ncbi:cache domain-containing protein [Methanosarcina sp. T3]|uniref:cache domain-containing protein n=1 Tax=Methanosarcina sp. T3 TaxID=3439062 RepID=UPI003F8739D2
MLLIQTVYEYKSSKTNEIILEEAEEDAHKQAHFALKKIVEELDSTRLIAEEISTDLSSGKLKNDSMIKARLLSEMENNPGIFSIVVAYSPSVNAGQLHSFHFKRDGSYVKDYSPIQYNYTSDSENTAWYNNPLKKGSGLWNSPYFGTADRKYLIDYSVPFYLAESGNRDEIAGIVGVSHSLEGIRAEVGDLDLGNTGYGFILSGKGVVISCPFQKYLCGNISELAKEYSDFDLISQNVTDGGYRVTNSRTGQSFWVFHESIPSTDWTLGIVLPLEETLMEKKTEKNRAVILIMLAAFAFSFSLSLLFISLYRHDLGGLWILAFIFSFLCVMGMGFIWYFALNYSSPPCGNGDLVVFDMVDVETVLQHSGTDPETPRVPTGVFLETMEFSSSNDIILTGYVWQNLSEPSADKASPGFSFPESKEVTIEKAYVNENEGVVGWHFKTTLRQQFDYSRYPFDREYVWIRFWGNASEGNILIPDFDSYDSLMPENLPGLERSLVLEGWEPQKTFFSYRVNSYNTDFGAGNFSHSNVSELYFNVEIKRNFKDPFVSNLLSVMVISILLFAVLTMTTRDEKKTLFSFSSSGVLSYCSSLFFVLIVAHASLRTRASMHDIIYLEYFYFIMYLAILAVSLNSIVFGSGMNIRFITAKDNLYVKLLYWPVILGCLLLITLLNFY